MTGILVTGSSGFIGSHLVPYLQQRRANVFGLARRPNARGAAPTFELDLERASSTELASALRDIDTVIHLAARAHIIKECAKDPSASFREANVEATRRLAIAAAAAGVRRFVYLSTIGVHGSSSGPLGGRPLAIEASSPLAPHDLYSESKLAGEVVARAIAESKGMEYVVVRPPMVIGPGVGGNFLRLLRLLRKQMPLPLATADAVRNFVSVDNLCGLLDACIDHPNATGAAFVVADDEALSTRELVLRLARLLNVRQRLFPVPRSLARVGAWLTGRRRDYERLFAPLRIDDSRTRRTLGWTPHRRVDQTLQETVEWFLRLS